MMNGEFKPEMQCADFEAMLAEAVEGTLRRELRPAFTAHHETCPRCAPLYAEAELGWRSLKALQSEEVVLPPHLLENILRATSRATLPGTRARRSWWQRVRELPVLGPVLPAVLQPRLGLALAMIFVTVAAIFSFAGRDLRDLRYADLRPSALRHDFYETQGKVMKFYENIRFVYEIESRMRTLRREAAPPDAQPEPEPHKELKNHSEPAQPQGQKNWNAEDAKDAAKISNFKFQIRNLAASLRSKRASSLQLPVTKYQSVVGDAYELRPTC